MVRKICLDSDIIIALLRKDEETKERLERVEGEFVTTVVNIFEIWHGRKVNETISALFRWLPALELNDSAARLAADLLRNLKQKGEIVELRDLFIAAVCIDNNIELLSFNQKHFERFKKYGLKLTA